MIVMLCIDEGMKPVRGRTWMEKFASVFRHSLERRGLDMVVIPCN